MGAKQAKGADAGSAEPKDRLEGELALFRSEIDEVSSALPNYEQQLASVRVSLANAMAVRTQVLRDPDRFGVASVIEALDRLRALEVEATRLSGIVDASKAIVGRWAKLGELEPGTSDGWDRSLGGAHDASASVRLYRMIEDERMRIARDMHDGPAQSMSNLVLQAEILERLYERDPEGFRRELEEFKIQVRNALEDTRRFIFQLRPMALDDLGLFSTARTYCSEWSERVGVTCRFNVAGPERRPVPDIEGALFRLLQEALNNVHKHARAKRVEVTITVRDGEIVLSIKDDGVGFDPDEVLATVERDHHLGLVGMRERVAMERGQMELKSAPDQGTELIITFASAAPQAPA